MATERDEIFLANSIIEEFGIQAMGNLPVNIDMILQVKGFTVIERELPEDLVAILDTTEKGHPLLVTESKLSDREARFTKARELGHYLLSKSFSGIRTDKAAPPVSMMASTNDDEDYRASRFAAALLMPRKLLTESIRETWKPSLPHQSDDSEMLELLSTVGTTFAVGLGVVLTAYALGATRRR